MYCNAGMDKISACPNGVPVVNSIEQIGSVKNFLTLPVAVRFLFYLAFYWLPGLFQIIFIRHNGFGTDSYFGTIMICNARIGYLVPAVFFDNPHETFLEIRKSRFLAQGFHAESPAKARAGIEARKVLYPDATHNCWAYLAGPPGDTARIGSSDDGEPHHTAGRPMLNVLLHGGIGEIAVVVTRWFGGIKLGTGGLARAYQESVQTNLLDLPVRNFAPACKAVIRIAYSLLEPVRRVLAAHGATIEEEKYSDSVEIFFNLPLDCTTGLTEELARLSNGKTIFELC